MNKILEDYLNEEFMDYTDEENLEEDIITDKIIEELEQESENEIKNYTKEQISRMVVRYQRGEKNIYDAIYKHYIPILKRWGIRKANSEMACDLLDTVLLNAINSYDISKKTQFDTFFWTCANNHIVNERSTEEAFKRKSNKNNLSLNKVVGSNDSSGIEFGMLLADKKFDNDFKDKELEIAIKQMKDYLKDTEYKILNGLLSGLSIKDIGEELNMTTSGVCMSLKRLRKKGLIAAEILNIVR